MKQYILNRRYWVVPVLAWGFLIGSFFFWNSRNLESNYNLMAKGRGHHLYNMMQYLRLWNAMHGGVYVKLSEDAPPNEHLDEKERTLTTLSGLHLVKVNPAYMTRQIADIVKEQSDTIFHLTSLKPLNPDNTPDLWEREALLDFERGETEKFQITEDHVARYMAPLKTEKSCLECHKKQGYSVGDVRGGLSVSYPAESILLAMQNQNENFIFIHLSGWILLSTLTLFSFYRIRKYILILKKRESLQEEEIHLRTSELRDEIQERRRTEEKLVDLNRILKTNNECKEAIVSYCHREDLLREICRILIHTGGYHLAWFGIMDETEEKKILPIVSLEFEGESPETVNRYWEEIERGFEVSVEAIKSGNVAIVQSLFSRDGESNTKKTQMHSNGSPEGYYIASLPIRFESDTIGAMNVYTISNASFSKEELDMLKNLSFALSRTLMLKKLQVDKEIARLSFQESEERLRSIMDTANDPILVFKDDRTIKFWNRATQDLFGYTQNALLSMPGELLLADRDKKNFQNVFAEMVGNSPGLSQGKICILTGKKYSGEEFSFEISLSPWFFSEKNYITGIIRDVTERIQLENDLRKAKDEAESANKMKSAFLATMSHEIRTPLNTIIGIGELIAESKLDESQQKYVNVMRRSGETLLSLINDILDLSKIESGQLELDDVKFNLYELIENTLDILIFPIRQKGLVLTRNISSDVPIWITGDPDRLRQIILNLVGNSVKFTSNGEIKVEVGCTASDVLFSISDTGCGISPDRLESIFQPFVQANAGVTRNFGGTGLGLTICKRLVKQMGGDITVQSEEGKGSRFDFNIKFIKTDIPAYENNKESEKKEKNHNGTAKPLSILIVDDLEINQLLVQGFLKNIHCVVDFASNGKEAVDKFKGGLFDVILMDMQMPVMDGYEATSVIRGIEAEKKLKRTPIIALTADAMREDVERTLQAGCDSHMAKPLRKTQFLELILDTAG